MIAITHRGSSERSVRLDNVVFKHAEKGGVIAAADVVQVPQSGLSYLVPRAEIA
jgi:hypothetical protein